MHVATEQTPALIDYRYVGTNPSNYACFGSEESICPEDNLYRIIGVIPTQEKVNGVYENRVKLIKNDYYTETESGLLTNTNNNWPAKGGYGYRWSQSGLSNLWEESQLNKKVLNTIYWNHLGEYQEYISKSIWYLGTYRFDTVLQTTTNEFYNMERNKIRTPFGGNYMTLTNIGLMYASDFGFSINEQFDSPLSKRTNTWLYEAIEGKYYEWGITPESTSHGYARCINFSQYGVSAYGAYDKENVFGIRPTFYLNVNVLYGGGDGTIENPYRISMKEE